MIVSNYHLWLKEQSFPKFKHGDSFVFLGSCFSDELGAIIRANGFESLVNPGGTIFHPLAIAKLIEWTFEDSLSLRILQQEDVFFSSSFGFSSSRTTLSGVSATVMVLKLLCGFSPSVVNLILLFPTKSLADPNSAFMRTSLMML